MKWLALLLSVACISGGLPPLPGDAVPVSKPRLSSPKESAFRISAVPMAVFKTQYCYWDFPAPVSSTGELTPEGQPIIFTFTNLLAFIDVKTNNGPWFRKRTAPYPYRGGTMGVTNTAPMGAIIMFRSGFTWLP